MRRSDLHSAILLGLLLGGFVGCYTPHNATPLDTPPVDTTSTPEKLRVLILYEQSEGLTPKQSGILTSVALRKYTDAHCLQDGKVPAFRAWDKDVDPAEMPAAWRALFERVKGKPIPLMAVEHGKSTDVLPLPADAAAVIGVLKKWGGE